MAAAGSAKPRNVKAASRQVEKARYFYRAGIEQLALLNEEKSAEYIRHAYRLDSLSPEIGLIYAKTVFDMDAGPAEKERLMHLFRRYNEAYPDDYSEAKIYADIAANWNEDPLEAARVLEKVITAKPTETNLYFSLAEFYAMADSMAKAEDALDRYERAEGADASSTSHHLMISLERGDTTQALQRARNFAFSHPLNPEGWYLLSATLQSIGKLDSALYFVEKAEDAAPDKGILKMEKAKIQIQRGDTLAGVEALKGFLRAPDLDMDAKIEQLYQIDMMQMASHADRKWLAPVMEEMVTVGGSDRDALEYGASYFGSIGDFNRGASICKDIYDLDPSDKIVLATLFSAYVSADRYSDITSLYESVHDRDSLPDVIYVVGAYAYQQQKQHDKALKIYLDQEKKIMPTYTTAMSPEVYTSTLDSITAGKPDLRNSAVTWVRSIGDSYINTADTVKAFTLYEQALAAEPSDPLTLNNYAYFLALAKGDLQKALEMSEKAVSADPENTTYLDTYAYILFKLRQFDRAEMYMRMGIDKLSDEDEGKGEYYDHYGDILYMTGDETGAIEYWNKALATDPSNALIKKKIDNRKYFEQ